MIGLKFGDFISVFDKSKGDQSFEALLGGIRNLSLSDILRLGDIDEFNNTFGDTKI